MIHLSNAVPGRPISRTAAKPAGRLCLCAMILSLGFLTMADAGELPDEYYITGVVTRPAKLAEPAADPLSIAAATVVFNRVDKDNCYMLVIGADEARLDVIIDGERAKLAGPEQTSIRAGQEWPLLVKRTHNRITCFLSAADDRRGDVVLSAEADGPTGGVAGLMAEDSGIGVSKLRIQPMGRIAFSDDFMRTADDPDGWTALSGSWQLDTIPNPTWSSNAFRYLGGGEGPCLAAGGKLLWCDYAARAAVLPGEKCSAAGLAFYVESAADYLVFRWTRHASTSQAIELVRVRGGREKIIERAAGQIDPRGWYELGIAVRGDNIACFLDGRCVFAAEAAGLRCGKIGLYCRDAEDVRFDDVIVRSTTISEKTFARAGAGLSSDILPERSEPMAKRFRTDRNMQEWATELGSWVPEGSKKNRTYRHVGMFPGDFSLRWTSDLPMPFIKRGPLQVMVVPESGDVSKGYAFHFQRDKKSGGLEVQLTRAGEKVADGSVDIPLDKALKALAVARRGSELSARVDGRPLCSYVDADPPPVSRLRLRCRWYAKRKLHYYSVSKAYKKTAWLPMVQEFEADGPLEHEYSFHRAPVDWRVDTGKWEVTARWICLPMFSWLGGRSHEAAIFWNKRRYSGYMAVDLYAAMMMNYGPMSGYDRYGDVNITVCADGDDLSSGYTVMFGGYGNTASCILRKGEVVARSTGVVYPPRSRGSHNRWYHPRVEKLGNRIVLSVGNRKVISYTDPNPLKGKHVAIWTWNRGIMLARATVWAEHDDGPEPSFGKGVAPTKPDRDGDAAPQTALDISSKSHPTMYSTFDSGLDGWHCPTGEHGGDLRRAGRGDGGCLHVENPHTGGDFAAFAPFESFAAADFPHLSFDYRFDPDVKLNLYFRTLGKWHVVGLTGPTGPRFHAVRESRMISGRVSSTSGMQIEQHPPVELPRIAALADGEWHRAELNLLDVLRKAYPATDHFNIEHLHFANWSNSGYLQCGFGGNRRGASYDIDDFFLGAGGPASGAFTWEAADEKNRQYAWIIDQSPDTAPPTATTPTGANTGTQAEFDDLETGEWFLHISAREILRHHRFRVDVSPPTVAAVEPAAGAKAAPTRLILECSEPGASGLDPADIEVTAGEEKLATGRVEVSGEPSRPVITCDLAGLVLPDGGKQSCTAVLADRAGNRAAEAFRWEWTFDRSKDTTPPTAPVSDGYGQSGWDEDFETPFDEWRRFPGSAWVEADVDDETASSGRRSLRIEGGPGPFRCYIRTKPFDVTTHPILMFDYLADSRTRWDLAFQTDRGWRVVAVNGATKHWPTVSKLSGYTPDGKWHRAVLPLGEVLTKSKAFREPIVKSVAMVNSNLNGPRSSVLRLDGMKLVPAIFTGDSLRLKWRANDISGIQGYSYIIDDKPGTEPPGEVKTQSGATVIKNIPEGAIFLHCRALDRSGNWGPTAHQPLLVHHTSDVQPPEVVKLFPPPGSATASDTIRVRVADEGAGIAGNSLKLTVAGRTYTTADPELRFLPDRNIIEWKARTTAAGAAAKEDAQAPPFADGANVVCSLAMADLAGNAPAKPVEWSWKMDYDKDEQPPPAPYVSACPTGALTMNSFEDGRGHWMGRREGWAAVTDDFAATGDRAIGFGGFSAFMFYHSFDVKQHPIVGFDYRLEPGAKLNLMLRIENRNFEVRFNSGGAKYPHIGKIEDVKADGQWHACRFNLASMLPNASPRPNGTIIDHLGTLIRTSRTCYADNFYIAPANSTGSRVRWSIPGDPTGIKGFGFVLDREENTTPAKTITGAAPRKDFRNLEPGKWYFHIRACDGAGNWSETTHKPVVIGKDDTDG